MRYPGVAPLLLPGHAPVGVDAPLVTQRGAGPTGATATLDLDVPPWSVVEFRLVSSLVSRWEPKPEVRVVVVGDLRVGRVPVGTSSIRARRPSRVTSRFAPAESRRRTS